MDGLNKQQKIECESTDLEKLSSAITFITCALETLNTVNIEDLDATNGAIVFGVIKMLQCQKIELNDALDDLKIIEGREPWDGWQMTQQQLHWTHRKPTRAGWYWSKFINPQYPNHKAAITVMHVTVTHNRYKANGVPLDEICKYGTRLWAGPLTPPDAGDREDG